MKIDVRSAFADIMKMEGVEYVFGHTGGHIMHLWDAVDKAGMKPVFNKQEGNAVFMADGYARITKKAGIVLGTTGPGVTNMVTGLSNALLDSIPLIAIGAGVPTFSLGRNAVQDTSGRGRSIEQRIAMKAVCKQAMSVITPETAPEVLREAFKIALSGRPGPVYVEVPSDYWCTEIEYNSISPNQYKNVVLPECNLELSQKINQQLNKSKRPLVIIGEGADELGIKQKLFVFLNDSKLPFSVSPMGKNFVDEFNPQYLGVMRSGGTTQKVYEYLKQSDFVLFLGDRMHQAEFAWVYPPELIANAQLAQVDSDHTEIGRVFPVDFSVVGSITSFLNNISIRKHPQANQLKQKVKQLWEEYPRKESFVDGEGIHPLNLNTITERIVPKDSVIVTDTGYAKSMAIHKYRTHLDQSFLVPDKNGPMGFGTPAALGACLAQRKRCVICFVGDGGFQMTLNELATAMNYDLKVIFIIENNGGCQLITDNQQRQYGSDCVTRFKNPDYVLLAQSFCMEGYRVETSSEFEKVLKKALKAKRSVIIDAKIDQSIMEWE